MVKIAPSILSANFAKLGEELLSLEQAGADMIHIDVMDGHFVPNLTFGSLVISSVRKYTSLPFDVHLMIEKPENHIEQYIKAGADILTIHPETTRHVDLLLNTIKSYNIKTGISLLPTTAPDIVDYVIDKIDLILVMAVNPGFGGQNFIKNQLNKIGILAQKIKDSKKEIMLSVDGGIDQITANYCMQQGANVLVSGNFIFFNNTDYKTQISKLRG